MIGQELFEKLLNCWCARNRTAVLGLMAVATWLGKAGKNNKMFFIPIAFMLIIVTLTSLCLTIKTIVGYIAASADYVWSAVRLVISILLVVLAVVIAIYSAKELVKQAKEKQRFPSVC